MSDQRSKFEEQALDAILLEVLGKVEPPDLQTRILARLAERDKGEVGTIVATSSRAKTASRTLVPSRSMAWTLGLTAVVAASVLLLVWMRGEEPGAGGNLAIAANQPSTPDSLEVVAGADEVNNEPSPDPTQPLRPRGIPLVMDSASETPSEDRIDNRDSAPTVQPQVPAVTLVSKQFDSELVAYWNAIGIQPSGEADSAEVAKRLTSILGVKLPADAVADPEKLRRAFAREKAAREVAFRWLQQITDRGMQRVDQESRDKLTSELAACMEGKQPFDRTVASWINGDSPLTSSFYTAISHAGRDAMARRLAALTMNADLRCIRCHDSTIEGSGHQQDYWGFAALLARGVSRDADGHVTIDPERDPDSDKNEKLFFELPDGRQRLAEPLVSKQWIDSPSAPAAETVKAWAAQLVGSEALARGAVNSLWQLVHGQPLRGRVVDPITAPHNDALDRIEDHLVQDLIRSRFDVARTLSLIVASPATRRAIPSPLLPENALVVSESDKREAINAVNAFAAALPRPTDLSLKQRLDQLARATGGKLDQDGRPFVAQIGDTRPASPNDTSNKPLADDFPVRGESLPVQWLTLIGDEQSQIEHLAYLAGMQELPDDVRVADKAMQEDGQISKELRLNRDWWLLRP